MATAAPVKKGKKRSIVSRVNLIVKAREATPQPPIGSVLGQRNVSPMEFCKTFNAQSESYEKGTPLPVLIDIYNDKSFSITIKTPLTSYLLRKAVGAAKGSDKPNKNKIGTLTSAQLEEIAKIKMPDLATNDLAVAMRTVTGTAKSMGIVVEEGE